MSIAVRLPDIAHWKAQVKCQAGCPVATDAGRYVQLVAENRPEEAYLVARAPKDAAPIICATRRTTPATVGSSTKPLEGLSMLASSLWGRFE